MIAGNGIVFMAAHAGQGWIMNEVIDPFVIDEGDLLRTDLALDRYDPANGFFSSRRRGAGTNRNSLRGTARLSFRESGASTTRRVR